jgi:2-dehydro-3-deoxyphosphooctonate aldolase (KDO 8-P synthase)
MSPQEMSNAVAKVKEGFRGQASSVSESEKQSEIRNLKSEIEPPILLTERGTFFGYNRLVNDFTGLHLMKQTGCPVVFDITHSTQQPAGQGTQSGGNPHFSPLLARAAIATGCVDGLFLECHPDPKNAKSDPATMLGLDAVEPLLRQCQAIYQLTQK